MKDGSKLQASNQNLAVNLTVDDDEITDIEVRKPWKQHFIDKRLKEIDEQLVKLKSLKDKEDFPKCKQPMTEDEIQEEIEKKLALLDKIDDKQQPIAFVQTKITSKDGPLERLLKKRSKTATTSARLMSECDSSGRNTANCDQSDLIRCKNINLTNSDGNNTNKTIYNITEGDFINTNIANDNVYSVIDQVDITNDDDSVHNITSTDGSKNNINSYKIKLFDFGSSVVDDKNDTEESFCEKDKDANLLKPRPSTTPAKCESFLTIGGRNKKKKNGKSSNEKAQKTLVKVK